MPTPESNNADDTSDWRRDVTVYLRWVLIVLASFSVVFVIVLSQLIDPAQPPG